MSIRTWAVTACLKSATSFLKLDRLSRFPNASDLARSPAVIDKDVYAAYKGEATFIVVERGMIAYLESPARDFEQYECKTLLEFMRRYFARKIDSACTIEMAMLEIGRTITGDGKLSIEEFMSQRKLIESRLTETLERYLRSTTFKVYKRLASI